MSAWGIDQFRVYREHIEAALHAVPAKPMLRGSKKRDDILAGCRFYRVEHHYIVYFVEGNGVKKTASVIRGHSNRT